MTENLRAGHCRLQASLHHKGIVKPKDLDGKTEISFNVKLTNAPKHLEKHLGA